MAGQWKGSLREEVGVELQEDEQCWTGELGVAVGLRWREGGGQGQPW